MRHTVLLLLLFAAPVLGAERATDKDIKQLIERVNNDRDRFEDQLDGDLKRNVLRGPQGEVDVERFLDDLQENIGRLKDRFSNEYAASAECTTVLQQASLIQRFMSTKPPNFKGASEWNRLASTLGELATAYGTAFPLPEGATARRMNDREVQKAAEDVAKTVDLFKKEVDSSLKANKVDEAARRATLEEIEAFKNSARKLASRLGDGQPASGEAKAVLDQAGAVQAASSGRPLSAAAKSAWASVRSALEKVSQGFRLPMPTFTTA